MRHPRRLAGVLCALGLMLPSSAAAHTVLPGETLSGIAAANGLTTEALAAANGLSPTAFAIAGANLTIPAAGTSAPQTAAAPAPQAANAGAPAAGGHLVTPGETLSGIAAANGLTTQALASANGLSADLVRDRGDDAADPRCGQRRPPRRPDPASAPVAAPSGGHLVTPGETLSGIAAANGLTTQALAAANGLTPTLVRDRRDAPADPRGDRVRRRGPGGDAARARRRWAATSSAPATRSPPSRPAAASRSPRSRR